MPEISKEARIANNVEKALDTAMAELSKKPIIDLTNEQERAEFREWLRVTGIAISVAIRTETIRRSLEPNAGN
jgi:hypothetical protein